MISVALIDDHAMIRGGLRSSLEKCEEIKIVGEAANAADALEMIDNSHPDVVFLDLQIPGAQGVKLCLSIIEKNPKGKIIVFTAFLHEHVLKTLLMAGINGYLLKDSDGFDSVEAVKMVYAGKTVFDPPVMDAISGVFKVEGIRNKALSPRELQILQLMAQGYSNQDIADELHLSINTIKGYIKDLAQMFSAKNRVEIIVKAYESKLI